MNQLAILDPKTYVTTAYQPFNEALENAIAKLPELVVRDITTKEGMTVAKQGRALFRDIRISLEKKRAEVKAPIIEIGKLLDSRAKEIFTKIEPLEDKFSSEIKAEEERIEAVKAEKIRLENERQERIQVLIDGIRNAPALAAMMNSTEIELAIDELRRIDTTSNAFAERADEAAFVLTGVIAQVQSLLEGKKAQEQLAAQQESARLEAERKAKELEAERLAEQKRQNEELAAERAKLEADKAKQEAEYREARKVLEESQRIERAKLSEEKEEIARQMAEIAAHKAAEQAKIEAEKRFQAQQEAESKRKEEVKTPVKQEPVNSKSVLPVGTAISYTPLRAHLIKTIAIYFDVGEELAEEWLIAEFGIC